MALGNIPQALAAARLAVNARPEAPRHLALLGFLLARNGQPKPGLFATRRAKATSPALELARARIHWSVLHDVDKAIAAAKLVIADETATEIEKAWARAIHAVGLYELGNPDGAATFLKGPSDGNHKDEPLDLLVGRLMTKLGRLDRAERRLAGWDTPLSADSNQRHLLRAEMDLAAGLLDAVQDKVAVLQSGPDRTLLEARLREAQGKSVAAFELLSYRSAAPPYPHRGGCRPAWLGTLLKIRSDRQA